jgi:hypothetical protein
MGRQRHAIEPDGQFARREEAKDQEAEAKEIGIVVDADRFSRRQVTKEHNEECRRLLKLMGNHGSSVSLLFLFLPTNE